MILSVCILAAGCDAFNKKDQDKSEPASKKSQTATTEKSDKKIPETNKAEKQQKPTEQATGKNTTSEDPNKQESKEKKEHTPNPFAAMMPDYAELSDECMKALYVLSEVQMNQPEIMEKIAKKHPELEEIQGSGDFNRARPAMVEMLREILDDQGQDTSCAEPLADLSLESAKNLEKAFGGLDDESMEQAIKSMEEEFGKAFEQMGEEMGNALEQMSEDMDDVMKELDRELEKQLDETDKQTGKKGYDL